MNDDPTIVSLPRPFQRPLLVSFRYRCTCVGQEMLTETCVLDLDMDDETFVRTMRRLRENVMREVAIHLEKAPK